MENKSKRKHDDYDSPWKEVIEQYFQEFITFFFPMAYRDIDWSKGYKFMDKELQQITRDARWAENMWTSSCVCVFKRW